MNPEITVELYQQDGTTPVLVNPYPTVKGLSFSSRIHGGFLAASFGLDTSISVEHPELEFNNQVKIRHSGTLCWQGRIEDRKLHKEIASQDIVTQALGPYATMNDVPYLNNWVDRRRDSWWHPDTANTDAAYNAKHKSDMFAFYTSGKGVAASADPGDVLGISALDGKRYPNLGGLGNWYAMWKYEAPSSQTVKRLTFDYKTNFPRGTWRMAVFSETGNEIETGAGGGDDSRINATGSGSKDCILNTPSQKIWIFLQAGVGVENDLTNGMAWLHTDGAITYNGANWSTDATYPSLYRTGSDKVNQGTNATDNQELTFTGRGFQLFGSYRQNSGIVEIYLKRGAGAYVLQDTIDMYDASERFSVSFYETQALDWDTYTVKVQTTNTTTAPSGEKLFHFDYLKVLTEVFAEVSNVIVYCNPDANTAIPVTADRIIKHALTNSCPDIAADQTSIGNPGVTITDAIYEEGIRVTELVEKMAQLGDGSTTLWDFAVWDDAVAEFAARPTAVTHVVYLDDVEMDYDESIGGMWNSIIVKYEDDRGGIVRLAAVTDADSIAKYGLTRTLEIDGGRVTAAQAAEMAAIVLEQYKDPGVQCRITLNGNLYDDDGLIVPLCEFRAGSVLKIAGLMPEKAEPGIINNINIFLVVQAEYDADSNTLTLIPGELPVGDGQ